MRYFGSREAWNCNVFPFEVTVAIMEGTMLELVVTSHQRNSREITQEVWRLD